ncbi:helix-turn-helix domain-containing protein [Clostridium gasigenes]|nr:helix-turn-helix domain-containing protein [Clostridium gasigenes]
MYINSNNSSLDKYKNILWVYKIITRAKEREKGSIEELITIFSPQINKYSRVLNGEDTKQNLIISLIRIVDTISINNSWKDKALLGYISKSLKNEYIRLSKSMYNQ